MDAQGHPHLDLSTHQRKQDRTDASMEAAADAAHAMVAAVARRAAARQAGTVDKARLVPESGAAEPEAEDPSESALFEPVLHAELPTTGPCQACPLHNGCARGAGELRERHAMVTVVEDAATRDDWWRQCCTALHGVGGLGMGGRPRWRRDWGRTCALLTTLRCRSHCTLARGDRTRG